MTDLAYACVLLEIPFDPGRLYEDNDENYRIWLGELVDRVNARRRQDNQKVNKGG